MIRYEAQKAKFLVEGKVDKYGAVRELLLFHGTTTESVNLIVEHNFTLDHQPLEPGQCLIKLEMKVTEDYSAR